MPFNISPGSLLLILAIVLVIFGTKKLRNLGSDLGGAIKGFRTAMDEAEEESGKLASNIAEDGNSNTTATKNKSEKTAT